MAQVMPAQWVDLGCLDRGLKRQRVAIVDALAAPLEHVVAVLRQGLQNLNCVRRQRHAQGMARFHFAGRDPCTPLHRINLRPGQGEHRAHAQARQHGEPGRGLQVIR